MTAMISPTATRIIVLVTADKAMRTSATKLRIEANCTDDLKVPHFKIKTECSLDNYCSISDVF